MLPEQYLRWGYTRNCIRELMEYGVRRKAEIGAENVYDFSIGNPSVPSPEVINRSISELLQLDSLSLHGYTTAAGLPSLRERIADQLNGYYGLSLTKERIYVTCGAASSLAITLRAVLMPGEEVLGMAPFFPEYRVFTEASGGTFVPTPPRADFQIDMEAVERALTDKTKALILNSPNNPSGALYSEETLRALSELLRRHEEKTGNTVYLLSDEPYREVVYDVPYAPSAAQFYDDTIICYSFSKAMSIPGERIGYIAVSDRMRSGEDVYAAVMGAGRGLGYINAPSLFQRVIERSIGQFSDISQYRRNREMLCSGLDALGYEYVQPGGAFYLFVKALEPDAKAFSEHAKRHELLLVPSDDFGIGGWFRAAYCVSEDLITRAMPAFRALMEDYRAG